MEFELITFLCKDVASGGGGSPAAYAVDGGYLMQGMKVGPETRARVIALGATTMPDTEDLVFVPANVIEQLRASG